MDDSSSRLNFNTGKKKEIYRNSWKERLKISKITSLVEKCCKMSFCITCGSFSQIFFSARKRHTPDAIRQCGAIFSFSKADKFAVNLEHFIEFFITFLLLDSSPFISTKSCCRLIYLLWENEKSRRAYRMCVGLNTKHTKFANSFYNTSRCIY